MSTFKIVNDEENSLIRISGSIIFNRDVPVLGMNSFDRPLYGTEVYSAIKNHLVEEGRKLEEDKFKGYVGDKVFTISDTPKPISEMSYYMKNYKIEKTLYTSSKMMIDIMEDLIVVDLIEPDQYTSSVDLNRVEKKMIQPNLSAKVDLSVKYSKGSELYGQDLTFEAFSYNDSDVSRVDFVSTLGDVVVEYVDGIVRVIPDSKDVTECIISNCVITYGCQ